MSRFAIIAEGPTDQIVIESILRGFFKDDPNEPEVNFVEPPRPLSEKPSGWGHVFKALQRKRHEEALIFNDYVVIHIDTDVQEEPGFDVPRRIDGVESSINNRIERVIERLKQEIDPAFFAANRSKFLFAIAVDTIECWLLPLFHNDGKAAKTTGCLETMNQALRKKNLNTLSAGTDKKFPRAYEEASKGYQKRGTLASLRGKNPSLEIFISNLDGLVSMQAPAEVPPATTPPIQSPVIEPPPDPATGE